MNALVVKCFRSISSQTCSKGISFVRNDSYFLFHCFGCLFVRSESQSLFDARRSVLGHLQQVSTLLLFLFFKKSLKITQRRRRQGGLPTVIDRMNAWRLALACVDELCAAFAQSDGRCLMLGIQQGFVVCCFVCCLLRILFSQIAMLDTDG